MHDDCNNRSPEGHGLLMTTVPSSSLCSHVFADGAINNVIVSVSATINTMHNPPTFMDIPSTFATACDSRMNSHETEGYHHISRRNRDLHLYGYRLRIK